MSLYKRDDPDEYKRKKRQEYVDKKKREALKEMPPENRPGFQDRLAKARKRQREGKKESETKVAKK